MQALVQQHVAALDRDGFTTIRRAVDPALVDSMRAAFESYLATVQERELPLTEEWVVPQSREPGDRVAVTTQLGAEHAFYVPQDAATGTVLQFPSRLGHTGDTLAGNGRLQETHRYTLNLPWLPPFSDAAVSEHPLVLAILESYWGGDDRFSIGCLHANTPMPGALYQRWHRDGGSQAAPHNRTRGIGARPTALLLLSFHTKRPCMCPEPVLAYTTAFHGHESSDSARVSQGSSCRCATPTRPTGGTHCNRYHAPTRPTLLSGRNLPICSTAIGTCVR